MAPNSLRRVVGFRLTPLQETRYEVKTINNLIAFLKHSPVSGESSKIAGNRMNLIKRHLFVVAVVVLTACNESAPRNEAQGGLLSLNGTELYVKTMGSGEPIIVIHGGPVLEHGYLLPHLEPLSRDYRLIFFDQRLSGRSSAELDSTDVRMENFVEDIEAVRSYFGLERVHVMGHSWGGLLAMKYALEYPERLNSLVLLNSMPASSALWQEEEAILASRADPEDASDREEVVSSEAYANDEPDAFEALYRISFRKQFHDPALVDSLHFYIAPDLRERSRRFGAIMQDMVDYDLHEDLRSLKVAVLLLYGADEPAVELSGARILETLENGRLVVIPRAGHFPFVEQPDRFLSEVRRFLGDSSVDRSADGARGTRPPGITPLPEAPSWRPPTAC